MWLRRHCVVGVRRTASASHRRLVFDQLRRPSHGRGGRLTILSTVGAAASVNDIPHLEDHRSSIEHIGHLGKIEDLGFGDPKHS
jgi:hypothetical protein